MPSTPRLRALSIATLVVGFSILALDEAPAQDRMRSPDSLEARVERALGLVRGELQTLRVDHAPGAPLTVPVVVDGRVDAIHLRPATVRADHYRLLVQRADGTFLEAGETAEATFRGELAGTAGSRIAGSMLEDGLHARILLPDGSERWLEPVGDRVEGASEDLYVLYATEDVAPTGRTCGLDALPDGLLRSRVAPGGDPIVESATGLKIAELACDADYEYFLDYGTVPAVESRIQAVVNSMNVQYERDVAITHVVTTIVVRTSPSQPYTSTDPNTLLNQFRSEWNANQGGIPRDVAQLFTGKSIDGSVIGIAWVGVVCNSSYAYGLVQSDFNGNFSCATDLSAHELGHNWNASHCSCPTFTMNPYITCANQFNPSGTIPTITSFRDSIPCLDDSDPPPPPDPGINLATADYQTQAGTIVAGSYASTHDQDDVREAIQERTNGGKPSRRRSDLSHTWTIPVVPGFNYSFFVDAHHTPNLEGDDFTFSYSRDDVDYTPMLTVTKTSDDNALQRFDFPEDVAGTLFVRAEDTDDTAGNGVKDTLYVDQMYVFSDASGVDTTPPSAPSGLLALPGDGLVDVDWSDNAEADLAGYDLYRSTSPGGPYTLLNVGLLTSSGYRDVTVTNGTTYVYVATAVDASGNESVPSLEVKATPNAGGGPSSFFVSQIVVVPENVGGGNRAGRADVTLVDDLGGPAEGASVTGRFSGDLDETIVATTDATGRVTLVTSSTKKGSLSLTFCVDAATHPQLNYDPSANVETCDQN